MATLRPSLPSRSTSGWYGASRAPGATATPNSAPSAGFSGASGGPPAAPASPGAGTPMATTSNKAAQLRARTTEEYARNSHFGQRAGTFRLNGEATHDQGTGPGSRPAPRRGVSGRLRPRAQKPVRARRGHGPLGPDDRRAGEHGHPRALPPLAHARRPGQGRPRGAGVGDLPDRLLPQQGQEPPRPGPGARGSLRRRGANGPRRSRDPARRRPEDGQRRALGGLRPPRPPGRHPRRPHHPPARAHHFRRPGQSRARARRPAPPNGMGRLLPPHDPPRPQDLHRPPPPLRRLLPERHLPVVPGPCLTARNSPAPSVSAGYGRAAPTRSRRS